MEWSPLSPFLTNSFWSRWPRGIPLFFTNRTSEMVDIVIRASPFYPDLRSRKWVLTLGCTDGSSCFSNALWLFYSLGRKFSSRHVWCRIECYIVLIHLSVLLPTKYSVLDYALLNNLMPYKKRCVIYELTPRWILFSHLICHHGYILTSVDFDLNSHICAKKQRLKKKQKTREEQEGKMTRSKVWHVYVVNCLGWLANQF